MRRACRRHASRRLMQLDRSRRPQPRSPSLPPLRQPTRSEPAAAAPQPAPAEPAQAGPPPPAEAPPGPGPTEAGRPGPRPVAAVPPACRSEFAEHCPGVRPGGPVALRCLQVNAAALSPACQSALAGGGGEGSPPPEAGPAPPPPGSGTSAGSRAAAGRGRAARADSADDATPGDADSLVLRPGEMGVVRQRPARRRPHHRVPCRKRAALVASVLWRDRASDQINTGRTSAISTARRSRAWRRPPGPRAWPRRFADGCGRRIHNRCRR